MPDALAMRRRAHGRSVFARATAGSAEATALRARMMAIEA
jgi:hypothetical protein